MTRPETCSAAGGAISVWVNVINCPGRGGIISSYGPSTGSVIYCYYHVTGYDTHVLPLFPHKLEKLDLGFHEWSGLAKHLMHFLVSTKCLIIKEHSKATKGFQQYLIPTNRNVS